MTSSQGSDGGTDTGNVSTHRTPSPRAWSCRTMDGALSLVMTLSHPEQWRTPILANRSFRWSYSSVMVPTVDREVLTGRVWSMAMVGGMFSMESTSGFSMRSRNCRA